MSSSPSTSTPPTATFPLRRRRRIASTGTSVDVRISFLCNTALGSPFLAPSDPEDTDPDMLPAGLDLYNSSSPISPRILSYPRPSSPAPSADFSIINSPAISDDEVTNSNGFSASSPSFDTLHSSRTTRSLDALLYGSSTPDRRPLKSIFPRIWDALSSPARLNASERYTSTRRGKARSTPELAYEDDFDYAINYMDLPPLDGDEGELVDDEACFIDVIAVTGVDFIRLLPPEISLMIFSRFLGLSSLAACLAVSKIWRVFASDNSVWQVHFSNHWDVNLCQKSEDVTAFLRYPCLELNRRSVTGDPRRLSWGSIDSAAMDFPSRPSAMSHSVTLPLVKRNTTATSESKPPPALAPGLLDWRKMYCARLALDDRWGVTSRPGAPLYEPDQTRLTGHRDSVYCVEFDSSYVITGSRDQTIRVWCLHTGLLISTFTGHRGSVLCLKFEKDWNLFSKQAHGLMVSGSSDKTVRVWDIWLEYGVMGQMELRATEKAVLTGHTGGVLDLRIDSKWIVSCSKDTSIRIWDRETLQLRRVLGGHEGPVNAVGLQDGQVVSASGDGKMILWDIDSGERVRIFQGHDRGLACVDFNADYIISGSNDCTIKIWRASTGECLRTLVGHEALVRALAFDPRSGRLVSASYDKSIRVWDWKKGRMIREFSLHTSYVFDVKFSKDKIISTSHDRKIVILDFAKADLDTSLFV